MARDYESELKQLRQKAADTDRKKVQYETRKDEATKRKAELEKKCETLNINPADIGDEVKKLEGELDGILAKISKFFPDEE